MGDLTKTKTKIKNVLLTIFGTILIVIMAGEIENPDYWWVQFLAAIILFVTIKVSLGGKDGDSIY